jgi:hypothetical protein
VIGDYLTEINVTSPTGIRQVKRFGGADIAALIWDAIETKRWSFSDRPQAPSHHTAQRIPLPSTFLFKPLSLPLGRVRRRCIMVSVWGKRK